MGRLTDKQLVTVQQIKVGRPRFELGTNRLKAEYSTVELATRKQFLSCSHGL